ncbi:MAG TPA: peptidoglycan binding domain-containing protein [Patescibacteria group bacterium]|nr:peptidoglycan binding domain-containing protein [Patescibacteria group bacterium]
MLKKYKKTFLIFFSILFSVILVTAIVLFSYQRAYAGKIYQNVYFGDINLSAKTKTQAEYLLKNRFQVSLSRDIEISANSKSVKVKLADTGLTYDYAKIVDQGYKIGRGNSFLLSLKSSFLSLYKKTNLSPDPKVDEAKYNDFLKIAIAQLNTNAQDATLQIQNGEVMLQNSQDGQTVVTEHLADQIVSLAGTSNNKIVLVAVASQAKITNASFDLAKQQATDLLARKYLFTYQDKKYSPTKAQIGIWIEFATTNNQTVAQFNKSNIKAYLNNVAKDFEITSLDRKINASTGEILDAGRDGLYLNKESAVADLLSQSNNVSVNVVLATTATPAKEVKIFPSEGLVLGRFEGKYIDVTLSTQQLCRIEGSTLLDCNIVSSGKASMPTPTGTYAIQNKNPRAWSAQYGLWMPWWEAFSGSYGFHELPEWPNGTKEGANHLGIPVSHGCVRLGVGPAETLYNWTDIGTPVYIHK